MKVFGIGLNKTGTKTLGACMKTFGFLNKSYDKRLLESFSKGRIQDLLTEAENFDSFEDWPWPLVYREMDQKFPEARFILSLRRDPDTWFQSLCRHAVKTGPTEARKIVYGFEMPHEFRDEHLKFYERHNREVSEYFGDREDKLLKVCWENGDGWAKLAEFLGREIPDITFPHENRSVRS